MQAEWKEFLISSGAEFDGADCVVSFGNPDAELRVALTGTVFADLSQRGVLAVRGQDAEAFLQGQFTNDVLHLDAGHSQLNGYCSAKGRLLANFRLWREADAILLSMPRVMLETVTKRLQMFVLRSAVSFEDMSERRVRLGVSGSHAEAELGGLIAGVPVAADEVMHSGEYTVLRLPGLQPRFEVHGPLAAMRKLWDVLNVRGAPIGTAAWELLDILAGIPAILPETADAFVPQMVNYQIIGGVNFKKGCYPGQEVVARMQYLGKLKRQMYLARVDSPDAPRPGDDVYSADDPEQSAGKIVNAQPHPDGGYQLLAVVQIASREGGQVHLGSAQGPLLTFGDLPYPLGETA
ncbi:MAG TPA: folate-binding protein YgfZ [Gammaproteobacteria bacterium]